MVGEQDVMNVKLILYQTWVIFSIVTNVNMICVKTVTWVEMEKGSNLHAKRDMKCN